MNITEFSSAYVKRLFARFFTLFLPCMFLASCDFSRVSVSCNDHLADSGLGQFEDRQRGVIRDKNTGLEWFRCSVGQRHTPRGCVGVPALLSLAQAESYIAEIAEKAGGLYDLFVLHVEALEDIGKHLDKSKDAYETAFKRLSTGRGNLVKRSEELKSLGAKTKKAIADKLLPASDT